ncbi:MAG: dATP/dGTP diphosphohydrolase domain-containing protein [Candidatus Paceibacterota bacterium]|jgi:hypothetical protein
MNKIKLIPICEHYLHRVNGICYCDCHKSASLKDEAKCVKCYQHKKIHMNKFITKDSGKRVNFDSGFQRDVNDGKPRYDLIPTELLKRLAELYQRGAEKYDDNNWRKAESPKEINRFKESAWRHFIQWASGEMDEDHAIAAVWNIFSYEWHTQHKNKKQKDS